MQSLPRALDETAIACLVDTFYERVREDALLGPVFNAAVHDWPAHKRTLTDFWCSVALRANRYRGNPMGVHRALSGSARRTSSAGWRCGARRCRR